MHIKKLAVAASATGALVLTLVTAAPASADYAPVAGDAVGVGSDTLQHLGDFVADGNHLGATGYNALGNLNKVINFSASADGTGRLAYGTEGDTTTTCSPGFGTKTGTGNANVKHVDTVCQLNPTVILRAGLRPVQRPNGSGAGANALKFDMVAGLKNIDYTRASSKQGSKFTAAGQSVSRVTVGTEDFTMLTSSTTNAPAAGLTSAQLKGIYEANTSGTNAFGTAGCPKWTDVGGASSATIVALYPQTASGTYGFFSAASTGINITTLGNCAKAVQENDPEAIDSSGDPSNAIEPISGARLNLFQGKKGDGSNNFGATAVPYFVDPSCLYGDATVASAGGTGYGTSGACGTTTTSGSLASAAALVPNVTAQTGGSWWKTTRDVYIYFRAAERDNTSDAFQPGIAKNLIRTLFANPCQGTSFANVTLNNVAGQQGCTSVVTTFAPSGITYGPGGAPYYASSAAQALISSSGFRPTYAYLATVTATD